MSTTRGKAGQDFPVLLLHESIELIGHTALGMERNAVASELKVHQQQQEAPADVLAVLIRPFDRVHEFEVWNLFVQCIREIAPPSARAEVDAYIARALAGDYRDVATHYQPGRGSGFWLALSRDGDLLGTFALRPIREDVAELRRMYVSAAVRRRGVARAMLAKTEALCSEWRFRRLFLTTSSMNQAAVALYRAAGFEQRDYVPPGVWEKPPPGVRTFAFEKALP
ncbi:GNAT family N-acetyltransferase [Belnapia sp. T18]|uniref:GNAT family N-acetyltransferase n=1 Tax=Belnapia arida TaxID=2804533 RepID=A0ABS1UBD5_9PROT|nr:GNAT family N-acetyltransferase [Belnapia arida]MBL6081996.1 GNAT family N-acetyltransferase [Belnapia arida]